jgi:hypothetical protein
VAPLSGGGEVEAPSTERNVQPAATPLAAWGTFYQIVGSSAGALTGLQFVVVALSAQSRTLRKAEASILAFGTPTVVHFGAVLLIAAIVSAPWGSLAAMGIALSLCGAAGIGYTAIVIRRTWRQHVYEPVLEDWLWHAAFPAMAYLSQMVAAVALPNHPSPALLWLGGATVLLLFTGIHNAWDAAAYIALASAAGEAPDGPPTAPSSG